MSNVRMRFFGQYLPKRAILTETLDSLGYHTETDDPFFTGVDKRHWADDTESTLFMGTAAAKDLIDRHDVAPNSIDLIFSVSWNAKNTNDFGFMLTCQVL